MRKTIMTTTIGIINLAEIELMEDCLDIFIPIVSVSENLRDTIEENVQKAKKEYKEIFENRRDVQWSKDGVNLLGQQLHITIKNKEISYELCFDFEDKEDTTLWADFSIEVDLSEYTAELKKLIVKAMIDKFF